MALVTLAVVGKENVPLYLRDFVSRQDPLLYSEGGEGEEEENSDGEEELGDPFGFFESKKSKANDSSSLKNQFIIHSALDRFDELTRPECMKDRPTIGPNSMYIGVLGCFDELKVYGYNTSTKTKFMAAVEDSIHDENQHFVREAGLKALFANMHELYVEYNLNPFSSVREREKISSRRFDNGVRELVNSFNETYGQKGMSWM
mmetsp:Transcript_9429/g.11842  ORF Transcript_9429/g.11842 Transcript_9429/m.11842 type:complete len:203 (-) Transcript_9429:259-867(-)